MAQEIRHHLTPGILMGYSAGSLPEAFNLMVAAHLSLCARCRAEAESYDNLGGELLEEADDGCVKMDASSLDATMAIIAGGAVEPAAETKKPDAVLPMPLQGYVGGGLDSVKWKSVGMGVKQAILPTSSSASARLLHIPAGTAMPDHGHRGVELTMVLKGAFLDDGEYFARGDVEIADSDLNHTPVADIQEDCICLAVTDAPLTFRGLIPKLAQPFLRI